MREGNEWRLSVFVCWRRCLNRTARSCFGNFFQSCLTPPSELEEERGHIKWSGSWTCCHTAALILSVEASLGPLAWHISFQALTSLRWSSFLLLKESLKWCILIGLLLFIFSSPSVLPILHWQFSCVCVSVCEEVAAPHSHRSHFLCFPSLQLNSFSSFPPSLCLVLVSPGFPPSKVSVELDPGLFFSLSTVGDGFCYRCQLLLRSFSLCFFKSCGWRWQEMLSNRNSELM